MRRFLCLFVAVGLIALPAAATAVEERVLVKSRTLSDRDFLRGDTDAGQPVELVALLSRPEGEGPYPVVVLLHGSDGPGSGSVWNWRRFLRSIDVATLELDSYSARGVENLSAYQSQFGQFQQIYDLYRSVEALAAHPQVDPARIAVMGFSRGGTSALYSAMARFQSAHGPHPGAIAAHLPFYPACNVDLVGEDALTGAPVRLFHGAEDDWTPAPPCRAYVERLAAAGNDAIMTEFPDAHHAFDNPRSPTLYADRDWQTSRDCLRREVDGEMINPDTGKSFTYADACIAYGPSVRYDDRATTAAQAAVRAFLLDEAFRPR